MGPKIYSDLRDLSASHEYSLLASSSTLTASATGLLAVCIDGFHLWVTKDERQEWDSCLRRQVQ